MEILEQLFPVAAMIDISLTLPRVLLMQQSMPLDQVLRLTIEGAIFTNASTKCSTSPASSKITGADLGITRPV